MREVTVKANRGTQERRQKRGLTGSCFSSRGSRIYSIPDEGCVGLYSDTRKYLPRGGTVAPPSASPLFARENWDSSLLGHT